MRFLSFIWSSPCLSYLRLWHFLKRTLSFSSPCNLCPCLVPLYLFHVPDLNLLFSSPFFVLSTISVWCLDPSPPVDLLSCLSFAGSPGSSSAGVFPELRVLLAVRPVPGGRDLPHGTDPLLVAGSHVGCQLPHCSAPPWGRSDVCIPQNPPPAQH